MQDSGVASEVRLFVSVKESERALGLLGPPRVLLQVLLDLPQVPLGLQLGLPQVPLDRESDRALALLGLPLGPPQVPLVRESERVPLPLQRPLGPPVGESDRLLHVD